MVPCGKCGNEATCMIGTVDHCADCAFALLEPLRQKHGVVTIARTTERDGLRTCGTCGATWIGSDFDCLWCARRAEWLHEDRRKRLLYPSSVNDVWTTHIAKAIMDGTVSAKEAELALVRAQRHAG